MDVKDDDFGEIQPEEMRFTFIPKTIISCVVNLVNKSDRHMAFKVKTTHLKLYCAIPKVGIIKPHSTCEVVVKRQAQSVMVLPCEITKEKFLIERAFVDEDTSTYDIKSMFSSEEWKKRINKKKLKVMFDEMKVINSEEEDLKVKLEIEELKLRLKKAEETISELMEQKTYCDSKSKKKHPNVFIKCFNVKLV